MLAESVIVYERVFFGRDVRGLASILVAVSELLGRFELESLRRLAGRLTTRPFWRWLLNVLLIFLICHFLIRDVFFSCTDDEDIDATVNAYEHAKHTLEASPVFLLCWDVYMTIYANIHVKSFIFNAFIFNVPELLPIVLEK